MAVEARRYNLERLRAAGAGIAAANTALAPTLVAMALLVALGASEAGFYPTTWYPAALFFAGLLMVTLLALGGPRGLPRATAAALVLLAAYAAWAYCSIAWADQQGAAWDGANRAATYAVVFALFALWPADRRGAYALLGVLGIGIAGVGLVELLRANASSAPETYFIGARLAEPTGYMNANVALWTLGLLPCVFLASRRELAPPLRGVCLAGAGLLAGLALMGQSRGWALALPLAILVYVVLVPGRARSLVALGAVAAGAAAVSDPVLAVHDELTGGRIDPLLADATTAILVMAAVLLVLGTIAGYADRRVPAGARPARLFSRAVVVVAAIAAVAAIGVAIASDPVDRVDEAWGEFKRGEEQAAVGSSRFGSGGTNRYDFWSVAWELFREEPLRGIGVENYQAEYLVRGESTEQPRFPHSLELGILSQTGLVGALLLAAAFAAALAAAARSRLLPAGAPERACAAIAVVVFVYWLLHASVDWFWEFPGITAPAVALLGLAGALGPRKPRSDAPRVGASRLPRILVAAPVVTLLGVSLTLPWLAERDVDRAAEIWAGDADAAYDRLDRAASLNPLSARPQLTEATIALRLGSLGRAEQALEEALEREPGNSYALLELGLIASERGEQRRARALIRRAHRRSPRDGVIGDALADLRAGRRLDLERVNRAIVTRARYRAIRTQ